MNTRRILKVLVAALLGTATMCSTAEGTWIRKADMPTARFGLSTSVVNAKIYAIGGVLTQALPTVEEYDPATDTWTSRADMPTARAFFSASVVNEKIYAIGGILGPVGAGLRRVEEYDPATDTWTRKADMPTGRLHLSTIAVNGRIYAMGGMVSDHGAYLGTMEEYDPASDTWTRKSDMSMTKIAFSTCVVNGKMYAIGGASQGGILLSTVTEYDPATGEWTAKANMPTARLWLSATSVGARIYAVGGCTNPFSVTMSTVEEYDPMMNIWIKKDEMSTARKALSMSTVNGKIYAIGGTSAAGWYAPLSTVEEYDATPPLVVDFNGDGIVDSADMCIMVDHWHTDYPLCDIAPRPFGDGIVDVQDLTLLAEYLFQDVNDPTLMVHWALDEAEGIIAADSVSEDGYSDGIVIGDPVWQPTGGQVNGAIQLDGVDDFVITSLILNPAEGPFSVFAWVKGGAPGQVVVSQQGAANWLMADTQGNLITELKSTGRSTGLLLSQTIITDGQWHRIGFVWNGTKRILYVDDVEAAEDTQVDMQGSDSGLYIGTGKMMQPGTYFSGLIDDIRIYNRAVSP